MFSLIIPIFLFIVVALVAVISIPFVGILIWLLTGSVTWGLVAAAVASSPFFWVYYKSYTDRKDLEEYYNKVNK